MDSLTSAVVVGEHIYGVAAITTQLVEEARQRHDASPTAVAALGRLMTGGVLMGAALKESHHRVILQVSSKGPVRSVVAEVNGACQVRGYLGQPRIHVPSRRGKLDVGAAVGKGILHVMKEFGSPEPYSGTVPLASGEIAEDLAAYFLQSEQIPSAVSLGVFVSTERMVTAAGGFLVQFHSSIADDLMLHIEQALAAAPAATTMVCDGCTPAEMLDRALGGLELDVVRHITPQWQCSCSYERVIRMLLALGEQELRQMMAELPEVRVQCEFCATAYVIEHQELAQALHDALS